MAYSELELHSSGFFKLFYHNKIDQSTFLRYFTWNTMAATVKTTLTQNDVVIRHCGCYEEC